METENSKKYRAVDPVSRFRWALSFPGVSPAAGKVLAALAYHADQQKLTCWPAIATLARETQVSERGVQCAIRQLEAAGAILTERSRGRTSNIYRLMIPPNPAEPAPTPQNLRGSTPQNLHPNPAESAPPNPAESAPQQSYLSEQSKEQSKKKQQQRVREREPRREKQHAAAASNSSTNPEDQTRYTCPKCERTWPQQFGAVCFDCDTYRRRKVNRSQALSDQNRRVLGLTAQTFEERLAEIDAEEAAMKGTPSADEAQAEEAEEAPPAPPAPPAVTETARTLSKHYTGLPEAWLRHQDLKILIGTRDLKEVAEAIRGIRSLGLPGPESFFADYDRHLENRQKNIQGEAEFETGVLSPGPNDSVVLQKLARLAA